MAGEYYPKCPACNLSHPGTCNDPLRPPLAPEQVFINPPKVPGTVEDSHAALAKEMRRVAARKRDEGAPLDISLPENEWAARVEQLGLAWAKERAQRAAREAEIATVREEIAKAWPDRITIGDLKEWAARLGGATS